MQLDYNLIFISIYQLYNDWSDEPLVYEYFQGQGSCFWRFQEFFPIWMV